MPYCFNWGFFNYTGQQIPKGGHWPRQRGPNYTRPKKRRKKK